MSIATQLNVAVPFLNNQGSSFSANENNVNIAWTDVMGYIGTYSAAQQPVIQQALLNGLQNLSSSGSQSSYFSSLSAINVTPPLDFGTFKLLGSAVTQDATTLPSVLESINNNNLLPLAQDTLLQSTAPSTNPNPTLQSTLPQSTLPQSTDPSANPNPLSVDPSTTPNSTSPATTDDVSSSALCNVMSMLTGTAGKAIATVAVVFLCVGLFAGKISWGVGLAAALGIGGLFGAPVIVDYIAPSSVADCPQSTQAATQ